MNRLTLQDVLRIKETSITVTKKKSNGKMLIQTWLDPDMAKWVRHRAELEGMKTSAWLRRLLVTQKTSIEQLSTSQLSDNNNKKTKRS